MYLVAGKNVVTYDVDAKTATQKGNLSLVFAGATFDKSSEDGTPAEKPEKPAKNTRLLVQTDTYGDSMGEISVKEVSGHDYYYYNIDGKKVGQASYHRGVGEEKDKFSVTDVTKSIFDEDGNITNEDAYQWGWYDYDDYGWQKTKNCISYTYNEDGSLATKTEGLKYFTYAYNANGTLQKESEYTSTTATEPIHTITYYNYDENGNALSYVSDGQYDSFKYNADLIYDENGNKIEEVQYKEIWEDPEFSTQTPIQHEVWTYDNNILTKYEKNKYDGNITEYPEFKREYTPVDGNVNVMDVKEYEFYPEYDDGNVKTDNDEVVGKWYNSGLPSRQFYTDFTGMDEMTAMEIIDAEVDEKEINTVNLTFSLPAIAEAQENAKLVIYRDCQAIDTVSAMDVIDFETGMCRYTDKGLKNGTYSYFIQPLVAPMGGDLIDEDADTDAEYTGYYSTTPVEVTVNTELPTVTDLKLVGGEVKNTGTLINPQNTYYADLAWKNPEDLEKYGFIKNCIFFGDGATSQTSTTGETINVNVDTDTKVYVVTYYQYGKAKSETIDVKIKDIESLATGVGSVTVNDNVKVTFDGNTVSLGDNANVAVFTISGQKVYEQNTNRVDLGNFNAGTYIVTVEKNGHVNAYKYNVK